MKYSSTRGGVSGVSFEEALFSGYAADGGMLLPDTIPRVPTHTLTHWAKLSYPALVKEILALFVGEEDVPQKDLAAIVDRAFSRFSCPETVKLQRLKNNLNVLELFHGPTLAFKDLALACVGQFLEYFLERRKKHVTILVGTSGDTGSAAIESVRGLRWVDIVVLLPRNRTSRVQELQMTTVLDDNVHVFRVDGTSDDLEEPIKRCFVEADLVKKHNLCSINSSNWTRVLVQIAHHFYTYFKLCGEIGQEVEIVVPTGGLGNVTDFRSKIEEAIFNCGANNPVDRGMSATIEPIAPKLGGVIAREMGLPVRLVSAVNSNDIVSRAFTRGDYSLADSVVDTLAPAMNIQTPYNIERILHLVNGRDSKQVAELMDQFEKTGKAVIPGDLLNKIDIASCSVDDTGIQEAMRECWEENHYLLCPHSAVAAKYHYDDIKCNGPPSLPRMCIATASPAKFEEAVLSAGITPVLTDSVRALASMPTRYTDMEKHEDWDRILRQRIDDIYDKSHP